MSTQVPGGTVETPVLSPLRVPAANPMPAGNEARHSRWLSFLALSFAGLFLFELAFFALQGGDKLFQIATFIGLPIGYSVVAAMLRKSPRFAAYWPGFFSYAITSVALLLMWLLDELPGRWLGLAPKSPPGMAVVKAFDAVLLLLTVIVLTRVFGVSLRSVFLQRGKLALGLGIGLAGFLVMAAFAFVEARDMGVSTSRLIAWAPWLLTFVLSNGFFEELVFRGLLLGKFEPLVGPRLANLVTALVFAIGHAGVNYTVDILTFMAVTFVFALIWGYVMQKTGALWGSSLFHAGADVVIMIGIFAGVKI